MKKQLIAIVAVFLVLCLCGCQQEAPPETTVPTTTAAPETLPTETLPPEPSELYAQAAAHLPEDFTMDLSIYREVVTGGRTFSSSSKQVITYMDYGTANSAAKVTETVRYGDYSTDYSELYLGGKVYATICGEEFTADMSFDDFSQRYAPLLLLNPEHYENITLDGNTFTFSGAVQAEPWLLDPAFSIENASGTATITDGSISAATYSLSYTMGEVSVTLTVSQSISAPSQAQITAPESTANYISIENLDAPKLLDQAYGYLIQVQDFSATVSDSMMSQAAEYLLNTQSEVHALTSPEKPLFKVSQNMYEYQSAQTAQLKMDEIFRDGKYTVSTDGGVSEPNAAVTQALMEEYVFGYINSFVPETGTILSAQLTDVGGIYLAEFTGTEDFSKDLCANFCSRLFNDAALLDNMASTYKTNTLDFYVAVDRWTGIPTAMGMTYAATHTIDSIDYILSQQTDYALDFGALSTYKSITGELAAETIPSQTATPLLYKVTGSNGQEMYLFGTIHVGDDRTGFLPTAFYDAFSASDSLAIECNNTAFEKQLETDIALSEKVTAASFFTDGTTTMDHISDPDLYDRAIQYLKATGCYNMNALQMKPVVWNQTMENRILSFGHTLAPEKGMESRLEALATEQSKPILEIESALFQLEMLGNYSEPLQELLLRSGMEDPTQAVWQSVHELYDLWCIGNEEALIQAMKTDLSEMTEEEKALYAEYDKAMIVDRNEGMLKAAIEYLESGDTVFYAVGLAHLLTDNGLVFTLRDAGYTVELVPYN